MPALKVLQGGTWVTVPTVGPPGSTGPTGVTGPIGPATTIVGEFTTRSAGELPVDGFIPDGWDGVGTFPGGRQMVVGDALINNNTASTTFGDLWQFVGATDPAGWINVGQVVGPVGPTGLSGPTGPTGSTGPPTDEVLVGPDIPTLAVTELWYDTDDTRILGPAEMPVGGTVDQALVKNTDLDGDVKWAGPHVPYNVPSGKVIQFPNAEGDKINLYSDRFGLGIASGTTVIYSQTKVGFRADGFNGAEWAYIDAARIRHGGHDMQRQIAQNGNFSGPWNGTTTSLWTPTLVAGNYWVMFGASGTSTTVAARTIDLKFDDVIKATARVWINSVNVHTSFVNGVGMVGAVTAGSHTVKIVNGGGTGSDVNDYGWVLLIPYT